MEERWRRGGGEVEERRGAGWGWGTGGWEGSSEQSVVGWIISDLEAVDEEQVEAGAVSWHHVLLQPLQVLLHVDLHLGKAGPGTVR